MSREAHVRICGGLVVRVHWSTRRRHCKIRWVVLYVERWLKAPMKTVEGELIDRTMGTPQGGVISPLLANLFLHYVFDAWVRRTLPGVLFCRYADDGLLHCRSLRQAQGVRVAVGRRFKECGLEINEGKSRIVYCKDVVGNNENGSKNNNGGTSLF